MADDVANPTVLLVEDDDAAALMLAKFLEQHGYRVERETRGDRAVARVLELRPAAVVLDGNLPGKDGFEVCREVRPRYKGAVIMLTARTDDTDQVVGLELGADDYVMKPAAPRVVLARLRACLRRGATPADAAPTELRFGSFHIDRSSRTVTLAGAEVPLTAAEFDLLWILASRAGTIVTRDDIQQSLRGFDHDALDRAIDMRVHRLRKRLGDDADAPRRIKTIRAQGYLFSARDWD